MADDIILKWLNEEAEPFFTVERDGLMYMLRLTPYYSENDAEAIVFESSQPEPISAYLKGWKTGRENG